ncbi:Uncharacterised protein [Burkholderia pseudomallei]|uniref:CBASS cGAMP synthase n=1 Tax=Burkholderia pseudomallei TaxID=28450 RepID=UPI000F07337C|nr:hypothetical protein [Burkholderia pseudomallei]CAJ4010662.1 Uncharacterised protein [Burkholderia pseudomallei]CAJ4249219.1 Uncharacterised protein [Burkholderia pseudomallei]CAJ5468041.1 Uncharacterised protein [Burkholderia pseudomallei]CAJ7482244.1 Uncharacterised protein [Burkholderia pseudomallei]CAJ7512286.1 Uncharacterised protein [Burkholderia pseudomallei]
MLKLNKLFFALGTSETFVDKILPTSDERHSLLKAKNSISAFLREGIRNATVTALGMDRPVTPRFRTQGSWRYDTCVRPAHNPPQEMDWDLGVYLPTTVWEENGPPQAMSKAYFTLVEGLLEKLCAANGWTLDKTKKTCSRVRISPSAHIDVPLYAAAEDEFVKIMEKHATLSKGVALKSARADSQMAMDSIDEQTWDELEGVVLANRTGEWIRSDPNDVAKWFENHIHEHGPQLRRVSRYVKAWRDHQWPEGGPSSVAMMVVVARNFEKFDGRDDIALERAAMHLSTELRYDVRENGIDDEAANFNNLGEGERDEASRRASLLAQAIRAARGHNIAQKQVAIATLTTYLGPRIPDRPDWIDADSGADDVRRTPAKPVPPPPVGATSAG